MTGTTLRSLIATTLLLGTAAAGPADSPAQETTTFEISVFGAASFAVGDISDGFGLTLEGQSFQFERAEMADGFVFGGRAGVRFGDLQVEGSVGYWPTTQVLVFPNSVGGVEGSFRAESKVLLADASLLYHFEVPNTLIEPFLVVGGGVKSYDTEQPLQGAIFVGPTDATVIVGGGVRVPLTATTGLRIDIRDHISSFDFEVSGADAKLQNDVIVSVGLSLFPGSGG